MNLYFFWRTISQGGQGFNGRKNALIHTKLKLHNITVSAQWENSEAVPENESRRGHLQRFEIRDDDETQCLLFLHNNNNHNNNNDNNNYEEADKTTKED